ncbi:MAG: hypothetical protein LBM77_03060 [Spirochaetaceae bacterium]|jgi:hypothetical protein|nr:hypothetical protein [Spirochaetaceae bacterium]
MNGENCTITIKTKYISASVPYSEESIREAVSIIRDTDEATEKTSFTRQVDGVAGCVIAPLTVGNAPLLLALAFGREQKASVVSEGVARNAPTSVMYRHHLIMKSLKKSPTFDLIQDRGCEKRLYEGCSVWDFEMQSLYLRRKIFGVVNVHHSGNDDDIQHITLKLEMRGGNNPVVFGSDEVVSTGRADPAPTDNNVDNDPLYNDGGIRYEINGVEVSGIYGFSIKTRRDGKPKVFVRLHRILGKSELPDIIDKLTITAQVFKGGVSGIFKINLERLLLVADETIVNTADKVIGPLRYFVAGNISADVYSGYENLV